MFVSYSRSDFYFAEQLAVALRRRDLDVWFDVHELAPGRDWSDAIDGAIEECDVFVLVASRAALRSPYVQRERELAGRLGRSQVAVLAGRAALGLPTYDLRRSFKRGADRLASDLAAATPNGWRPRIRLPCPTGAAVVALAPALSVLTAAVLVAEFVYRVSGYPSPTVTHVGLRLALVGSWVALIGLPAAWLLWAFLRRRVAWLWMRGSLLYMPLAAVVGVVSVEQLAASLTPIGAIVSALGGTPDPLELVGAEVLVFLVFLSCLAAGVATERSSGLGRFLRTGAAPRRIRSRYVGSVPRPELGGAVRAYRLFAADDDVGVGDEVHRALAEAGIEEAPGGERDVVVLTDRTPADWLARDDLRDPLAVVATSIALPVRGGCSASSGSTTAPAAEHARNARRRPRNRERVRWEARAAPEVPERLEHLGCRGPCARGVGAVLPGRDCRRGRRVRPGVAASDGRHDLFWPAFACLALAPVPFVLARRLRRRRLTPRLLVGLLAVFWAAAVAVGLDRVCS